ncbi:MAG: thioredoxin domain-containing protein [Bacteroidetes bacterium]|nr:MAG: thioredoxin domain-containing protein [Bacteroidota bacterium]
MRLAIPFLLLTLISCKQVTTQKMNDPNHLINETSPYLLQHAHNPVDWYPWSEEAWDKAKKENKLVLISIGYSACHWCHVMEHESFENDSTAKIMNEHFICIKVDREERPDIDQIYMAAVQLMTGSGGWPLNCFTLPDGRPIYGGTYFPNANWNQILLQLAKFYEENPAKANEYATELTKGINQMEVVTFNEDPIDFKMKTLEDLVHAWQKQFDQTEGGPNRSPKFPLPNNYEFLLRYATITGDKTVQSQVDLTLEKMAFGGIYDQVGGGFARYSTDLYWKVPHFEKMLYDNAQLVSLYSNAYKQNKNPLYKKIVYESLEFIRREMTSSEGGFYSALDADSEGKEGKFYVWTKTELESLLINLDFENSFEILSEYFNINKTGYWEEENYILLRKKSDQEIAKQFSITSDDLDALVTKAKLVLLSTREKRIRPGLDDKILVSWNALMIKAYCDAYTAFADESFLKAARKNASLVLKSMRTKDGGLFHSYKNGDARINGYLEDYSFMIEALLALYECSFDEMYLTEARSLTEYVFTHFYDKTSGNFWFTSNLDPALISRKKEIQDNVIPASNSSLANALFRLGIHFEDKKYSETAERMLHNVVNDMVNYGAGYSNWALLLLNYVQPFREIVITGKDAESKRKEIQGHYLQNAVFAGGTTESKLPLMAYRFVEGQTLIYVCENRVCKLPVQEVEEALKLLLK